MVMIHNEHPTCLRFISFDASIKYWNCLGLLVTGFYNMLCLTHKQEWVMRHQFVLGGELFWYILSEQDGVCSIVSCVRQPILFVIRTKRTKMKRKEKQVVFDEKGLKKGKPEKVEETEDER